MNIIRLLLWAVMPQKLYLGGGGDGGAQAEADRLREEEAARDYQISQDKAKINALFGITDYDYSVDTSALPGYDAATANVTRLEKLIADAEADPNYSGPFGAESVDYDTYTSSGPDWYKQLADAQGVVSKYDTGDGAYDSTALADQAATSFDTRSGTLDQIYQDILNKYNFEKDKQYDRKSADVTAMLADRGLSRSTVGQSVFDRLDEIRDTTEARFEEGAGSTVEKIKAADEGTRQNLISMINAGGDYGNARTTALSELDTNLNKYKSEAQAADLTNLFKGMDELYGQKQYVDAYNQGQSYGSTNLVTPGSGGSSSGVTVNY